jgi:hypothetical protein
MNNRNAGGMTDEELTMAYLNLKADGEDADAIRLDEVRNELEDRGYRPDEEVAA